MYYLRYRPLVFLLLSNAVAGIDIHAVSLHCDGNGTAVSHANATGTFQVPGWSENGDGFTNTDPARSWNITQSVVRNSNTLVTTSETFLTIPVDAASENGNSSNYTYYTCLQFSTFPSGGASEYPNEDGTCASVATSECRQNLKTHYNEKAAELLSRENLPKLELFCSEFWGIEGLSDLPGSCQNYTDTIINQGPLGFYPIVDNGTCPTLIQGVLWDTGDFDMGHNRGLAESAAPDTADNFTVYDRAVQSIQNYILVRFRVPNEEEGERKADTQLICPRVVTIEQDSRTPPVSLAAKKRMGSSFIIAVFFTALALVM